MTILLALGLATAHAQAPTAAVHVTPDRIAVEVLGQSLGVEAGPDGALRLVGPLGVALPVPLPIPRLPLASLPLAPLPPAVTPAPAPQVEVWCLDDAPASPAPAWDRLDPAPHLPVE